MENHKAGFPPFPHSLEIPSGLPLLEWSAACTMRTIILAGRRFHYGDFDHRHRPEQDLSQPADAISTLLPYLDCSQAQDFLRFGNKNERFDTQGKVSSRENLPLENR